MIPVGEEFGFDHPENRCFGCSPHAPEALGLRFLRVDERTVESRYTVEPRFQGMQAVVHGGIQAVILDEVMSVAATMDFDRDGPDYAVTAELCLRYRRPVPTGRPLRIRAEREREGERELHVRGTILDADGAELTVATGRWRKVQRKR